MGKVSVTIEVVINEIRYQYDKQLHFTEHGFSRESDFQKAEALLADGYSKMQISLESQHE
jgi:hypothetical protein